MEVWSMFQGKCMGLIVWKKDKMETKLEQKASKTGDELKAELYTDCRFSLERSEAGACFSHSSSNIFGLFHI